MLDHEHEHDHDHLHDPPFFEITTGLNQSPDLNPIEMVWAEKKTFIASKFCRN